MARILCENIVLTGPFVLIVILSDEMFWIFDANSVFCLRYKQCRELDLV